MSQVICPEPGSQLTIGSTTAPNVTPLASRQPGQPARHISPDVLEFRLQQVIAERDELVIALEKFGVRNEQVIELLARIKP